jgi:hypothetical protein
MNVRNSPKLSTFITHVVSYLPEVCDILEDVASYCGISCSKAVTVKTTVFWDMMPCSLVDMCQHFGGTCCLNPQNISLTFMSTYQATQCHIPEDSNRHSATLSGSSRLDFVVENR